MTHMYMDGKLLLVTALAVAVLFATPIGAATITINVPGNEKTIQAAIGAAESSDTTIIIVEPGTYTVDLTISGKSNITLQGRETASTVLLSAPASNQVLTISKSSEITVRNFTWKNTKTGISVSDTQNFIIAANVFRLGTESTGVAVTDKSNGDIVNNTFYKNNVGITRSTPDTKIKNNFFSDNSTAIAISNSNADTTNISYNGFYNNTADGPRGTNEVTQLDPLFVNTASNDFHVRTDSAVRNKGSGTDSVYNNNSLPEVTSDLGAYGGDYADAYPMQVTGVELSITALDTTSYTAAVQWNANLDYRVSGYDVYYYAEPGASTFSTSPPVVIASATLSGQIPTTSAPAAPTLLSITPRNQLLTVTWAPVTGATGYEVRYGVGSTNEHSILTGNVSSYALTGLENGVLYKIQVLAIAQAVLHAKVKAHDGYNHQSYKFSEERSVDFGEKFTSPLSNEATGLPEATVPYPLLPNEGCFIATAAYGHYSAPQVQALRDFRDRYLLTHRAGRAFVTWYYDYGPTGAHYLNEHPALKPSVRVLLYPFVIGALFLTQAPLWSHLLVLLCMTFLVGYLIQRRWANISTSLWMKLKILWSRPAS